MNKKGLFLDLDGTLLNDEKKVTEGNMNAIRLALQAGHSVVINTGRPLLSALRQADNLGLTGPGCYLICYNGGMIYDIENKKSLYEVSMDKELVFKAYEEANRRGLHIQTYNDTHVVVEPRCDDPEIRAYCKMTTMDFTTIPDIHEMDWSPIKLLLIDYEDNTEIDNFRKWLLTWCEGKLVTFFSTASHLEVVRDGLSKGNAMLKLSELIGVAPEDTIACGDAPNDHDMIKKAGLGVCMANGTEDTRALADYITVRDNNHDGIAEVIEKFML